MQAIELFRVMGKLALDKGEFTSDIKEADSEGKSLSENLSSYMEKAKKFIVGLGIAAGIKKVAGDIWNLAKETSAAGDRIDKQSQALGMSRKAFQEWDYILAQSGASIDSLGMSMKTMSAAIDSNSAETAAGLSQLGLSAAHLQSLAPEEQFETLVRAFQKMPAGSQKSALALQLFGRNAQSLMPLLNSSSDSIDELRENAEKLGLIMSDEDVDASVAFGDALDDLSRTWQSFKMKIGAQFLPGFTETIKQLSGSLGNLSGALVAGLKTGDFNAFFSTLTTEIGQLVPGLVDKVIGVIDAIFQNADKLVSLAVSIITGLTSGIVKALPKLIEKLPTIINTVWEGMKETIKTLGNGIIDLLNETFGLNLPHIDKIEFPSLEELGTLISNWWDGGNGAKKAIEDACKWVLQLFGVPTETAEQISKNVGDWWGGIVSFVVDACSWVLGLFGLPTDVDTNKLKTDVETWFGGISSILIDACNWILNLFGLPTVDAETLKTDVSNWFGGLVNYIVDACSWVLGLFGLPTDVNIDTLKADVSRWFSGLSGAIIDACNWVLNIFGLPTVDADTLKTDVSNWFNGFVNTIVDACSWVLGLFGLPTDVDTEKLKAEVETWFSGISSFIIDACNWVLNLFGLPEVDGEALKADVSRWFDGIVSFVVDGCKWVLGLFGFPTDVDTNKLSQDVSNWWSGYKGIIEKACDWVLSVFGLPKLADIKASVSEWWNGSDGNGGIKSELIGILDWALGALHLPSWEEIVAQIQAWWSDVTSHLSLGLNAAWNGVTGWVEGAWNDASDWVSGILGGGQEQPSGGGGSHGFAKGLNYVPFDGYALLHRGETVLNQSQGREWRQGGGGGMNYQELYQAVSSAVSAAVSGIRIDMDGKQVGNAVTEQVSKNIYQAQFGRRVATL